jgi:hypothetical protein
MSKKIKVIYMAGDQDWSFVFIDRGNGVKGMSIF